MNRAPHSSALGLGIDAGGTRTRWALADTSGRIVAEGEAAGVSASQMSSGAGQQLLREALGALCRAVQDAGRPHRVRAGLTGFGGDGAALSAWLAGALALEPQAVVLSNDIEIAYLDSFAPGEGYLVYAGTGSIAAWIDEDGAFHRAGGRGVLLDDGGGGYWIAREALRRIWRLEDEAPGSWTDSALARAVFAQIGGSDWARSREFMYGSQRGEIGKLALAVAAAADSDPAALAILDEAGRELARLALALIKRCGPRPVALAGRAAELHPAIEAALRAALPEAIRFERKATQAHHAAARLAARDVGVLSC
jgi:glucosamine kinase